MKKLTLFLFLLMLAIAMTTLIAWKNRENILAHFLSHQLHVPVSVASLQVSQVQIGVDQLWVGNPRLSKTNTAFAAETLRLNTSPSSLLSDPLIIPSIDLDTIFMGIEYYDLAGTRSNWDLILANPHKMKSSRRYLIKTLTIKNLTVEITQANGATVRYPTIPSLTLHNISDETGFPVEEIQKAIFKLILQELLKQIPNQIFKQLPLVPFP